MTQPKIDVQSQARRANVTLESFIFPQNFEKNTNHVIKSSVEYYLSKGNKQKTDKVIGNLKRVFGPESMEGFSVKNSDLALKKIVEDVRKSTSPTIGNFVSDEAKKQIDAIVAELSNPNDLQSLKKAFKNSEKMLSENSKLSKNEKLLLKYTLEFTHQAAIAQTEEEAFAEPILSTMNTTQNDQIDHGGDPGDGYYSGGGSGGLPTFPSVDNSPRCSFLKWGCVFYNSTFNMLALMTYYMAFNTQALQTLIDQYSITYIASCCICRCKCKAGCPSLVGPI